MTALISLIPYIVILAIAALIGAFSGAKKSLISLIRTLVSLAVTFIAVAVFCRVVPPSTLFAEIFASVDVALLKSEAFQIIAGGIVYSLAAPFAFLVVFILVDLIMRIPAAIIRHSVCKAYSPTAGGRVAGAALKAVKAFLVLIVLVLPFANIFCTLTDGVLMITNAAVEEDIQVDVGTPNIVIADDYRLTDENGALDADEIDRMAEEIVEPIRADIMVKISASTPMRVLCNFMTDTATSGIGANNELSSLFEVAAAAVRFAAPLENYGENQKAAITTIVDYISESEAHREAMADMVVLFVQNADKDTSSSDDRNLEIITSPLFEILEKTTPDTVAQDLVSLRDIIVIMIDYDIPAEVAIAIQHESPERIVQAFANEDFLFELLGSLYANDDYRHMIAPVLDYAFTVIMKKFDPSTERMFVANVPDDYTEEFLHSEAQILGAVFADGYEIMQIAPKLSGNGAYSVMLENDLSALGRFVDITRESVMIGDGVTELFLAILRSSSFDNLRSVADILVTNIEAGTTVSVEGLLVAAQNFIKISDLCTSGTKTDTLAVAAAMREINSACDEETAKLLKEMIVESDIVSEIVATDSKNEAAADTSSKAVGVMIEQLAVGEFTDEEYEKEAQAIDVAVKMLSATTKEDVDQLYSDEEETREMVEVIANSKVASAAMIEIAYEDGDPSKPLTDDALELKDKVSETGKEKVREECKEYYMDVVSKGEDTSQIEVNFKALSAILDLSITDDTLGLWSAEANKPTN